MRKTIYLIAFLMCVSLISNGQVFNTGQTLKPRTWSIGAEPSVLTNGDTDFMLFMHGGYGLKKGIDFGMKLGVLGGGDEYFGGDIEFGLGRYFSLMGGAHHFGNFGLDGSILGTYPIRSDVRISSGFDLDINFAETVDNNDTPNDPDDDKESTEARFLGWIPISLEVGLRSNLSFIFEAEINVTDDGYHFIGGGLNFYI